VEEGHGRQAGLQGEAGANLTPSKPTPIPIGQGVLESVNHELIFRKIFAARRPRDSVYDFFVARKKWVRTDARFK
jgi:hypothetical protein